MRLQVIFYFHLCALFPVLKFHERNALLSSEVKMAGVGNQRPEILLTEIHSHSAFGACTCRVQQGLVSSDAGRASSRQHCLSRLEPHRIRVSAPVGLPALAGWRIREMSIDLYLPDFLFLSFFIKKYIKT